MYMYNSWTSKAVVGPSGTSLEVEARFPRRNTGKGRIEVVMNAFLTTEQTATTLQLTALVKIDSGG
jgi:hypothetical protein